MSEFQIVSLVALLGWLVLVVGGLRRRRLDWSKGITARHDLAWDFPDRDVIRLGDHGCLSRACAHLEFT